MKNSLFPSAFEESEDLYSNSYGGMPATSNVLCFMQGTLIATPKGDCPIEDLQREDLILSSTGQPIGILWMARRRLYSQILLEQDRPVCIRAGALGEGVPVQDLYLSADHGVIVDEMIVNASALVNGSSIHFVPADDLPPIFTYFHIETERHDEIIANGTVCESFIDYMGRRMFDNYDEYLSTLGTDRVIPEMQRPRVCARSQLPESTAARLGHTGYAADVEEELSRLGRLLG